MSGVKARKWILKSHFSGLPKREDLEIVEEDLPPLKDGGKSSFASQLRLWWVMSCESPSFSCLGLPSLPSECQ